MRILLLMRGVPGSGKSTFIKEQGLEPYTLSADALRLLYASPMLDNTGRWCISPHFDKQMWPFLLQTLEERMKRGCFTVVDATNIRGRDMTAYKKLANEYKYRIYVVDFTDITIEEAKKRNLLREEYKQVPENVIERMYAQLADNKVPSGITVIKPGELSQIWYKPRDLSAYKKVIHIGDIHGCYKPLNEYFEEINPQNYYIFLGDYIDRGSENAEVLQLLLQLAALDNVTLLEGNHEANLRDYGLPDGIASKEFRMQTAPELAQAGLSRKAVYNFYRKLSQCFCYTYQGKKVLVSHDAPSVAGKLKNKNARPVRAGLNTFEPIPPNSPFAITIATRSPRIIIHKGVAGGTTSARSTPVTHADRLETHTFCLVIFWKAASKSTQAATETAMSANAFMPNVTVA